MIGAAFGLAIPEPDVENQWMGDARDTVGDTVVERTQQIARSAASQVQQAAAGLTEAVTNPSSSPARLVRFVSCSLAQGRARLLSGAVR